MRPREIIVQYILSMTCESHLLTVSDNGLNHDHVYEGMRKGYYLGYEGELGGFLIGDIQSAVRITRTGDAYESAKHVNINILPFVHGNVISVVSSLKYWEFGRRLLAASGVAGRSRRRGT